MEVETMTAGSVTGVSDTDTVEIVVYINGNPVTVEMTGTVFKTLAETTPS